MMDGIEGAANLERTRGIFDFKLKRNVGPGAFAKRFGGNKARRRQIFLQELARCEHVRHLKSAFEHNAGASAADADETHQVGRTASAERGAGDNTDDVSVFDEVF